MRRDIVVLILAIFLSVTACQSDENTGYKIEDNLKVIVKNEKAIISSNPYDYIQQNQRLYNEIIDTGNEGLDYLMKELKESKHNGLKEWIMAKACEDILEDKNPVKEWSTGKEWITKYNESK